MSDTSLYAIAALGPLVTAYCLACSWKVRVLLQPWKANNTQLAVVFNVVASVLTLLYASVGGVLLANGSGDNEGEGKKATSTAVLNVLSAMRIAVFVVAFYGAIRYILLWINLIEFLTVRQRNRKDSISDSSSTDGTEASEGQTAISNIWSSNRIGTVAQKFAANNRTLNTIGKATDMDAFRLRRYSKHFISVLQWTICLCAAAEFILLVALPRPSKPILVLITATKGVPIVVMMVSALVGGTAKVRKYNKPIVSAQFTFAMVGLLGYLSMDWYFLWTSKNDGNRDQQTMFITIASVLFFESMYMATQVAKITKVSVKKVKAKHALTLKRAQSNPDVDGGDGRDDEHQSVAKISPSVPVKVKGPQAPVDNLASGDPSTSTPVEPLTEVVSVA